ncbi:hypothetical protein [Streptomyces sp. NBC_00057]|uniref:hypothetical protein n=1 Tax=Streptomyces sp. NBC_00057 TaxID=2975634 RepID=UPI00386A42AF
MTVAIGDQPSELAMLFADVERAGINIEDVRIEHATSQLTGPAAALSTRSTRPANKSPRTKGGCASVAVRRSDKRADMAQSCRWKSCDLRTPRK